MSESADQGLHPYTGYGYDIKPPRGDVVVTAFKTSEIEEAVCEACHISDNWVVCIASKEPTIDTIQSNKTNHRIRP